MPTTCTDDLRREPMMAHLMDSLEAGVDIGHYGRLVFAMIARHFMSDDEVVAYLTKNPDFEESMARGLLRQIDARGYTPPKRERVLEWMRKQEFPICPFPNDRTQCNVYRNLDFPEEVYRKIDEFYERGDGLR
jgi:DNA primase large subunit